MSAFASTDDPTARKRWRLPWPIASLRSWLVAVTLLATVPMAALMAWRIVHDTRDARQRIETTLRQGATALARAVDRELQSSVDALAILSHVESVQRGDLEQFERELASRRQLRPSWSGALLADRDGRLLFDTAAAAPGARGKLPDARVLRSLLDGAPSAVSGLLEGTPRRTLVAVPVRVAGELRYVLGAWIDAAVWQQQIEQSALPDEFRSLYDREFRLVARYGAPAEALGRALPPAVIERLSERSAGFLRGRRIEGDPLYIAWDTATRAGWGVGVGLPAGPVDAAQREALLTAAATAGACLLLGVLLALLTARRLTQPLQQLAARGAAPAFERIPVREISLLRDALLAAQAHDEVARERLRKKADEFETLFASSPIALACALDAQCEQVLHNPAMTALLGPAGPDTAVPVRHGGRVLSPAELPLQRAARSGEAVEPMELELEAADGRPARFVIATATPLLDEHGRPRGAIGALVDLSERRQVEARLLAVDQRLRQNQHLIDLAQEAGQVGFFAYRPGADALHWTPGQAKLFGLPPGRGAAAEHWAERIDGDDRARVEAGLRELLAAREPRETFEFRVQRNGDTRWLSTRVLATYADGGALQQLIGVSVDVTDTKRAEAERDAVVEREQAARREAEASNRAKDEFLAMLGHELRNPLSAITSAVEVLNRADAKSTLADNARNIIARQTRHLAHMMEDLLDVARVISGKVVLSRVPLDLAAAVRRCVSTLEGAGATREHTIDVHAEAVWIDGDTTRIDQVVNNLLTNALKYTPAGGRIAVVVAPDEDGAARLAVRDSGVGIAPSLLPRVFEPFVQGERTLDRRAGGLGVGLTLVRRLVELHGGRIAADSPADGGSLFTVRLPAIAAPAQAAVSGPVHRVPESRRRRVALIEDNDDARNALRALLELDGHTVSTANDGPSGLESLLQARPDVAVIDIGLPGLTGFEVARRSRAAGYAGRMIALSGYGQERDVQQALQSGFDAHLVKPVDAQALRRLLVED